VRHLGSHADNSGWQAKRDEAQELARQGKYGQADHEYRTALRLAEAALGLLHEEVMPPNTNRGPSVGGGWIRLGARKLAGGSCRDEVVAALHVLCARTGTQMFTVRDVYAEMLAAGTAYAESTVFKMMQRMKEAPKCPPTVQRERAEPDGFRVVDAYADR